MLHSKTKMEILFFDKLHFRFLQMPLFNKNEDELEIKFDKWCYFLKNLEHFDQIPAILNEPIFQKAFDAAALAGLSAEQRDRYEQSLIHYRDLKSVIETAVEEAVEEAVAENKIEIAKSLLGTTLSAEEIAKHTGLTIEQIKQLRK